MSDTYSIQVECSNCDYHGEFRLPKGTPAAGEHDCPNCGCKTATKARPSRAEKEWGKSTIPSTVPQPWVKPPWHPDYDKPFTLKSEGQSGIHVSMEPACATTFDEGRAERLQICGN